MSRKKTKARAGVRQTTVPPASPAPILQSPLAVSIALVALNLFVYAAVRHFQLVNWDDPSYITENPNIGAGLTGHSVWWALTTGYSPYWHPMTWLSLAGSSSSFSTPDARHESAPAHRQHAAVRGVPAHDRVPRAKRVRGRDVAKSAARRARAWGRAQGRADTCFWMLTIWARSATSQAGWQRYLAVLRLSARAMSKPRP